MTDKERIAELEAAVNLAVEWLIFGDIHALNSKERAEELRARAFPSKFETVNVERWECPFCTMVYHFDPYQKPLPVLMNDCCNRVRGQDDFTILTGTRRIPIVAKVKIIAEQIEVAQKEAHSANAKLQSLLLEKQLNAITTAHKDAENSKLVFP